MLSTDLRARASGASFIALSCVGALIFATPAIAQNSEKSQDKQADLGGVTVIDTAIDEGGYKVDKADSPKFTAPLVDTPRTVTVIPAQVIKDTASASLVEALRTVPGITFGAGEGGNPLGDRPFIRGSDSQASTYIDGVRDVGAQSREVFAVEQIEVVKGADSAMGGRGNAGGSLNLVTKTPKPDRFIAVSGTGGTDDYKRVTVDINQPLNDFVGFRLNGMWHDQDVAGRDAIWQKRWGIAPSVKLGLNGPTSLTVSYYHLETNELPDSGIPYLYTIGNAPAGVTETAPAGDFTTIGGRQVHTPRGAFYGLVDRDFRKTKVDNLTIRAEHDFGGVTLRNTSRFGRSEQNYILSQPDDQQGNVYGTNAANPATAGGYVWRRINTRASNVEGLINQTDLFGDFNTGGIKHSFTASAEFSYEKASNGSYVGNPATGTAIATGSTNSPRCSAAAFARYNCTTIDNPNPFDPWVNYTGDGTTVASGIAKSLPKTRTLSRVTSTGLSLFDTITISDALLINLGGRYDRYDIRVSPGLSATATTPRTSVSKTANLWTYQAGIVFKPASNGSIYVSTSTAATPPGSFIAQGQEGNALNTSSQALTDQLKVEKTTSYEAGTKWNLFDENLSLTLAVFQSKTSNARVTADQGTVAFVGKRRIRGVEIGYNGNITPEWNIFGGYTYMDAKIVDGGLTATSVTAGGVTTTLYAPSVNTGKPFPNTPKHSFTAFTNYKITPALTVGGGAIYMSKVYGGFSDVRTIQNGQVVITKAALGRMAPDYWRFDANASYQITDHIGLQFNLLNATNKRYFDKVYTAHYANQAAGRTALFTLNVRY
ncbi:MAG: TonB-dependent receptor [Sphingomonas sanxanigenens]|uniref:TonB-dependent receptor n=1 Tax=Sphingomonas sanxanigenens TaxID=397260 RepID=A0A2W5C721_9SPHN|nr:MAG: TonB-dependent receptor [Sphingomonas sanxanigenens]